MNNTKLAIAAVILGILSVLTYVDSASQAERFERGQKFLSQLNPDTIAEIRITKGDQTTLLKRSEDQFKVASANGYPAKNESINRFMRDLLEISLEKEVGSGEDLQKELEVTSGYENTIEVELKDSAQKTMVNFYVGKTLDGGQGNYIRRADSDSGEIYLTSRSLYLSTTPDNFLDKDLLDVKEDQIASIEGSDYSFTREGEDGPLNLANIPPGHKASANANQVKSILSSLRFDKVFIANDPEVAGLNFTQVMSIQLKDKSTYHAKLAQKGEVQYLQLEADFELDRVSITRDESEEELQKKSELLTRADEVQQFNNFHGSWVYQLGDLEGKKFAYKKADLVEKETEEKEGS